MDTSLSGIHDWPVYEAPIAIIDFETTGLNPGRDRVIEASVLRIDPREEPRLVFDTLINPRRRVSATEIHGITDDDVADAPEFAEIAGELLHAIDGCVLAAYNAYFDMRFLEYELTHIGLDCGYPYFCLMYLRPMLDLGRRCSLEEACRAHGIEHVDAHVAAADVQASAQLLLGVYVDAMQQRHVQTFRDLARLHRYKFIETFDYAPISAKTIRGLARAKHFKPRTASVDVDALPGAAVDQRHRLGEYWEALKTVVLDLEITDEELAYMEEKRQEVDLQPEQIRMLHAQAFATAISQFIDDEWLDDRETSKLRRLYTCLHRLGWAPGE